MGILIPDGLVGDGQADETAVLQRALDTCAARGGGRVVLPPRRYRTGAIRLGDHTTLEIGEGAVLVGMEDPAAYPLGTYWWQGAPELAHAPLIGAVNASRVALVGRGTIDGSGTPWWKAVRNGALTHPRPRLVEFERCRDVRIEGLLLMNSPSWTVHPVGCDDVRVAGLTIRSPHDSPNTDGVNPDMCRCVHITDCIIDTGDDCIAIKTPTERTPEGSRQATERVIISGCVFEHGHGGIVLGSEMSGGIRQVLVSGCIMRDTDRGIRLKTRRQRGGVVEDLRVTDIVMERVGCPFVLDGFYHWGGGESAEIQDRNPRPVNAGTPVVRRLSLQGIDAREVVWAAAWMHGLPESPFLDVSLRDFRCEPADDPGLKAGAPAMMKDAPTLRGAGLQAWHVDGLSMRDVKVRTLGGQPKQVLEGCRRVEGGVG